MISHPDERCQLLNTESASWWVKAIGIGFTFVAVLYATIRSGSSDFFNSGGEFML
eukprot:COSAG06_NODE_57525_length_280_cov_0.574586_1_plen_54_part_10